MQRKITKYSIHWNNEDVNLKVPKNSTFLNLQMRLPEGDKAILWFSSPVESTENETINLVFVQDYKNIPSGNLNFLGTAQCHEGFSTVHVFQVMD